MDRVGPVPGSVEQQATTLWVTFDAWLRRATVVVAGSAAASATVMIVPSTGRATARRAAVAAVRSRSATCAPVAVASDSASRRAMLVSISATMAPELPCADRMAPRTRASTRSWPPAAATMPSRVNRTLVPVSESGTG